MVTRAEHRRATLRALSDAAVAAFGERGAAATVDEIAAGAGVSRRTVFRHVDRKETLAFIHPLLWLDVFDDALGSVTPAPPDAWSAIHLGARAIAAHVDGDPEPPRRAFLLVLSYPELASGFAPVTARWIDRFAQVIASADAGIDPLRVRILAHATMGMIDAVTTSWLLDAERTYRSALDEGFEVMAPLFDA